MGVRTNYYTAFTLHLVACFTYATLPGVFARVLGGWYFPVWVLLCLAGFGGAFLFRCPGCSTSITQRSLTVGTITVPCYSAFPGKRCASCNEGLGD